MYASGLKIILLICLLGGSSGCDIKPIDTLPPDIPPVDPGPHNEYSDVVLMELWKLHNMARAAADPRLSQLRPHTRLDKAARGHAEWMANNNRMSHTGKNGSSFWDRVRAEGYNGRGGGENIAYGYSSAGTVINGWMQSPGHRNNILNGNWQHIGLGYAKASDNRIYWCAVFAHGGAETEVRSQEVQSQDVQDADLLLPEGISAPAEIEVQGVKLEAQENDTWVYANTDVPAFFMEAADGARMLAETNEIRGDKVYRYDPWAAEWQETAIDPKTIQLLPEKPVETSPPATTAVPPRSDHVPFFKKPE